MLAAFFNIAIAVIAFVVVICILVFVHEFGHFVMARVIGVGVDAFSIGFGKRLAGFKRGRTDYRLSAIPLGGYVKMVGEDPEEKPKPEDLTLSFSKKPLWKRFLIVLAGPLTNIILAFVIIFGLMYSQGQTQPAPIVGGFLEKSPALEAGLATGDIITYVDNTPINNFYDLVDIVQTGNGLPLTFTVNRMGQKLTFLVTPVSIPAKTIFGEDTNQYAIGVLSSHQQIHTPLSAWQAFTKSFGATANLCKLMVQIIGKMFAGSVPLDTLGGPIMVAQMAGEQAQAGILASLFFLAMLSLNLGVVNLVPIPILDGGHLLMYIVEAVTGRKASLKTQEVLNKIGLIILICLMALVFYNDFKRLLF